MTHKRQNNNILKVSITSVAILFIIIKSIMFFKESIQSFMVNVDIKTFAALITLFVFFIFYTKFTKISLLKTSILTSIFSAIAFSTQYNGMMLVNQKINFSAFVDSFQNGLLLPMLFFGIYFFVNSVFKA